MNESRRATAMNRERFETTKGDKRRQKADDSLNMGHCVNLTLLEQIKINAIHAMNLTLLDSSGPSNRASWDMQQHVYLLHSADLFANVLTILH